MINIFPAVQCFNMSSKGLIAILIVFVFSCTMGSDVSPEKPNDVVAEPTAVDPSTGQKCCPKVMEPIIPTAQPKIKYIVVPPLSVT
uniref:Secreted protein n=1 Tax=Anopheles minimus TaxID=112268 RepID=A0A182VQ43_9DIPT